jgi:hypothetical protein
MRRRFHAVPSSLACLSVIMAPLSSSAIPRR